MQINKIIKERRRLLGLTQQDLAEISSVGLRTIKAIESSSGNPSLSTLQKIAHVLGMELNMTIRKAGD